LKTEQTWNFLTLVAADENFMSNPLSGVFWSNADKGTGMSHLLGAIFVLCAMH
jgi:hypothetical protein